MEIEKTILYKKVRISKLKSYLYLLMNGLENICEKNSRRSQCPSGVLPTACWDCEFESRRGRGCLSFVSVMCYRADVFASG
jgi:hypothetical protein